MALLCACEGGDGGQLIDGGTGDADAQPGVKVVLECEELYRVRLLNSQGGFAQDQAYWYADIGNASPEDVKRVRRCGHQPGFSPSWCAASGLTCMGNLMPNSICTWGGSVEEHNGRSYVPCGYITYDEGGVQVTDARNTSIEVFLF